MSWLVAAVVASIVATWLGVHRFKQRHSQDPKTWPIVGAQWEAFRNFNRLYDWYLPFFSHLHRTVKLSVIFGTAFYTVDPLNVEYILKTNFPNYPKGKRAHHIVHDFLGDGIFSSDGETWKKHRKVASLEFSNKKLRDFSSDAFREGALSLIEILHSAASSKTIVDLQTRADLLSRFMAYEEGQPGAFTDQELRDAILNFVIAGRDSTAITLSWFIYCICTNPHVADRVFEETVEVLGLQETTRKYDFEEVANRISYETLSKMHYLHAALTETLRLYPAVPRDPKVASGDDVLPDGTRVKRGNRVVYVPYAMGRMEFLWGKDALTYNPNRWLQDGVFQPESPFKFSAFQAGPRICLGKESAYLQMKMTAALLLQFFRFQIVSGHVVRYRISLVMPMANGLLVHVLPR